MTFETTRAILGHKISRQILRATYTLCVEVKLHSHLLELNLHLRATQCKVKRKLKPAVYSKFDSIPAFLDVAEVFVQQSEIFSPNWALMLDCR